MMKKCWNPHIGLLIMRVALGGIFVAHGWSKFQGMEQTIGFFTSLGLGAFWAYVVSTIELVGGILVILGLWTSIASVLLALVMVGAYGLVKSKLPFMAGEIDMALFALAIGIATAGPGKYALGKKMACVCGRETTGTCVDCTTCTDSTCTCAGCK